jgi:hypothetical protein
MHFPAHPFWSITSTRGSFLGPRFDAATVQMYASSVSAMVRVARRLGVSRRAKPVLDMSTFLKLRRRERGEPPEEEIIPPRISS